MSSIGNALRWDGQPGHYEVHYLTLTDPVTGAGFWIRYTLLAPRAGRGEPPTAALWFLAMDPRPGKPPVFARRETFPIGVLSTQAEPFELCVGPGLLSETRAAGSVEGARWQLAFTRSPTAYDHVHPCLRAIGAAQTVLTLPQADLEISGTIELAGETIRLERARGGQAHLWGTAHARRWAWLHCNDFTDEHGSPVAGEVIDAVSVFVRRAGREVGPSTPVVGRLEGEDFVSTSPLQVLRSASAFSLTGWRFEADAGSRRVIAEVDASRRHLAGVTYHDPDGTPAFCFNSEIASLRLQVRHRSRRVGGWEHRATLVSRGRAHFEYGQRTGVPEVDLVL
jgi:hypothetical protein